MTSPLALKQDNILDLPALVRELSHPAHPVASYLATSLSVGLLRDLKEQNEAGFVETTLAQRLFEELNKVLERGCIYDEDRFRYSRVTDNTLRIAGMALGGDGLILANRLLLAEAYPCIFRLVYSRESGYSREKEKWFRFYVDKYAAIKEDYRTFCDHLELLLKEASAACAPLAIVQAREKAVASFAEKVWRKNYENPLCQCTDLAAARVITETQEEVIRVSEWIKRNFLIDEANSVDHHDKLKADEFGYLSVHYIVSLSEELVEKLGEHHNWFFLAGKKAEIQIRTLVQHAHASVAHDRVYKAAFSVPEPLRRDLARVSAVLEGADSAFAQTIDRIEAYQGSYGAYMDEERRTKEAEVQEAVLRLEPPGTVVGARAALKLALLKKSVWDWQGVADTLSPHLATDFEDQTRLQEDQTRLQMEYGYALCRAHQRTASDQEYAQGIKSLKQAVESLEDDLVYPKRLRVEAHACLAWAYGNRDHAGDVHRARDHYERAHRVDPTNPYILASHVGFEIGAGANRDMVCQLMSQTLLDAAGKCLEHARAGVELPWAYLTRGRLHLLAGEIIESLSAYCKAIHVCGRLGAPSGFPREILDDELAFVKNIGRQHQREEDDWVRDLLLLGLYVNCGAAKTPDVFRDLEEKARMREVTAPVVIVSGGTHPDVEKEMRGYREYLRQGFERFEGTLISGGTTVGIPGMVGDLAKRLKGEGHDVHARCYRPESLPADGPADTNYDQVIPRVGKEFSPRQLLQIWIDLLVGPEEASKVKPVDASEVKLLGFNGGPLALLEYRLALAMGAQVGVIRGSGRAASILEPDPDWADAPNLLWLPRDPMSVWAFIKAEAREEPAYVEDMGKRIHEKFLAGRWRRSKDRIVRPWEFLDEDIRRSNVQQAAFAEAILRANKYQVEVRTGTDGVHDFGPDEDEAVERMAEMEHGRWNVERLSSGWRYGPVRDDDKRIHDLIVPWKDLTDEVRGWDRETVRNWPKLLAEAGLEVRREGAS